LKFASVQYESGISANAKEGASMIPRINSGGALINTAKQLIPVSFRKQRGHYFETRKVCGCFYVLRGMKFSQWL